MKNFVEEYFQLKMHDTSIRKELLAGLTTFSTMAYIVVLIPLILSSAGMDFGAAMVATIISSSFATLLMGLLANYPFAMAPGLGLNAYFTYSIVLGFGHSWQQALGICFFSGILLLILTVLRVQKYIINLIPNSLRLSVAAGIGIFLAFIGLKNVGLVVADPHTFVALGKAASHEALLTLLGVVIIAVLMYFQRSIAIIASIVVIWIISLIFGFAEWKGLISLPPNPAPTFMQLDIFGAMQVDLLPALFSFLFISIFDTAGTLLCLADQAHVLDKRGHLPRVNSALFADGSGTVTASLLGTTTLTTFLESCAGIAVGGRTGLTAVVVSLLFLLTLFFAPFASSIPPFATAPALIIIGALMLRHSTKIDWEDLTEAIPAFVIMITIPLTFSIANGIGLGFILYPVIKLLSGKREEVHWLTWVLAGCFILKFIYV